MRPFVSLSLAVLLSLAAARADDPVPVPLDLAAADKAPLFSTFTDPATGTGYQTGTGTVLWTLPASLRPGWYWVEFTADQPGGPPQWLNPGSTAQTNEYEPYRFSVGKGPEAPVLAFSFALDPQAGTAIAAFRHPLLDTPLRLTARRSDHPLSLHPGDVLKFESRWGFSLAGGFRLVSADSLGAIDLETETTVPFHLFDETQPPLFHVTASNHGVPFQGRIDWRWLDALKGDVETGSAPVALPSEGKVSLDLAPKAGKAFPYGAYTLHVQLFDGAGRLLTHQYRNFTYSPRVEAQTLPDDWPFGFNQSPREPDLLLPIGLKHIRLLFNGWNSTEPAKGEYRWDDIDRLVEDSRRSGSKILYVITGTPPWASQHPENPLHPTPEQEKAGLCSPYSYPPKDWQDLTDFVEAFWRRYAPQGKVDVVEAVEVVNEPNVKGNFAGTYAEYAQMCQVVYEATKKIVPDAKVIGVCQSGGLHKWWVDGVLDAGAGKWMDLASTHNYEIDSPVGAVSIESKSRVVREALDRNGNQNVGICNTEAGPTSWGRWGETVPDEAMLDKLDRSSPYFDPQVPYKIKTSWRTTNEYVTSGYMVRAAFQQIEMAVRPIYYFKWQAGTISWVHDWQAGGNVEPKLFIPVQAVLSEVYRRYGADGVDRLPISSPNPDYLVFAHRLYGPEGRVTVLYADPKKKTLVMGDEVAGKAFPNSLPGEQYIDPKDRNALQAPPPVDQPLLQVSIPDLRPGAVVMDILARSQKKVAAGVARMPVYIIEPKDGAAWPAAAP